MGQRAVARRQAASTCSSRRACTPTAFKAVFSAADDYKDSVTLERALHPDALLAWEMNGEPLTREHGFPARLLIPGIYGMKNVKWLTGITIVGTDFNGFWQNQGWDDAAPYQTASRIDVPLSRGDAVRRTACRWAAWRLPATAGSQSVEVSTDQGQTWQPAQVKPGLSPYTWQLWRADIRSTRCVQEHPRASHRWPGHPQIRESTAVPRLDGLSPSPSRAIRPWLPPDRVADCS